MNRISFCLLLVAILLSSCTPTTIPATNTSTPIPPTTTMIPSPPSTEIPNTPMPTPTEIYNYVQIENSIFGNPNWEKFQSLEEFTKKYDIDSSLAYVHAVDSRGQLHVLLNPAIFTQLMQEGGTAFFKLNPSQGRQFRDDRNELVKSWLRLGGKIKMPEKVIDNDTELNCIMSWLDEWEPLDKNFALVDSYPIMITFNKGRDIMNPLRLPIVWYPELGDFNEFVEKLIALGFSRDQLYMIVMNNEPTPEFLKFLSNFSQIGL